jgi:hypothetical protein
VLGVALKKKPGMCRASSCELQISPNSSPSFLMDMAQGLPPAF